MQFIIIVLLLLVIVICLMFVKPVEINFVFDSINMDMHVSSSWLSLLNLRAETVSSQLLLNLYILQKRIISKIIKKKKKRKEADISLFRAVEFQGGSGSVAYGLNEPFSSGLLYGAIYNLGALFGIRNIELIPDFVPDNEYLQIEAKARINAGRTITKLLLSKIKKKNRRNIVDTTNLSVNVDYLFHSLENFTQNEGIIGKPVTQGDKTFLPIVSITVGYGGGNANIGKNQQDASSSSAMKGMPSNAGTGAMGLGAKLCTDAVIVINNQNVSLLPVNSSAGSIMDKIPQIITGMSQNKQSGQTAQA